MKRILLIMTAVLMLASAAKADLPLLLRVNTDKVNVRKAPNAKAPRLYTGEDDSGFSAWEGDPVIKQNYMMPFQLYKDNVVTYLEDEGDWIKFRIWVYEGYSMKKFFNEVQLTPVTFETAPDCWLKENMRKLPDGTLAAYVDDDLLGEYNIYFGHEGDGIFYMTKVYELDNPLPFEKLSDAQLIHTRDKAAKDADKYIMLLDGSDNLEMY